VNGKYKNSHIILYRYQKERISAISASQISNQVLQTGYLNIDGIKISKSYRRMWWTRQDAASLSQLLATYADHPNVGGVTVRSRLSHLQVQP
jgi:altronate hydrolase